MAGVSIHALLWYSTSRCPTSKYRDHAQIDPKTARVIFSFSRRPLERHRETPKLVKSRDVADCPAPCRVESPVQTDIVTSDRPSHGDDRQPRTFLNQRVIGTLA